MAGFTPMTQEALAQVMASAFADQPDVIPPNTDTGSSLGPVFQAGALGLTYLQNELLYIVSIERMANTPALQNGQPNPDLDSFWAPFGIPRDGSSPASGFATATTSSPVGSTITVPAMATLSTAQGNQYQIQPNGPGYNPSTGGYDITTGNSSVSFPIICTSPGISGNVVAGTMFTPTGSPFPLPVAISTIENAADISGGSATESDADYKVRATLTVSSGRAGTRNAIIGATLATQAGLIYSFGDRQNSDGSLHTAYFTMVMNLANTGQAAPSGVIVAANAAADVVRAAGISFQLIGPSTQTIVGVASIIPTAGFIGQQTLVQAAVLAQFNAFVNAIGLDPSGVGTTCSLARAYAAILQTQINGVYCVQDVINLTLNGNPEDISIGFSAQFVASTSGSIFTVTM